MSFGPSYFRGKSPSTMIPTLAFAPPPRLLAFFAPPMIIASMFSPGQIGAPCSLT